MKNFALLNENNVVINISIADENWDSTGWIDYTNKNCAIGYSYNAEEDIFVAPQPYSSWTRSGSYWNPPTPRPTTEDKEYYWSEDDLSWREITND